MSILFRLRMFSLSSWLIDGSKRRLRQCSDQTIVVQQFHRSGPMTTECMTNRHTWERKDFSSLYISCSQWISRAFFSECLVHSSIASSSSSSFSRSFSSDYTCALFPLSLVSCVSSLSSLYSIRPVAATAKAPAKTFRTTTSNDCRWFLHLACLCLSVSIPFSFELLCCFGRQTPTNERKKMYIRREHPRFYFWSIFSPRIIEINHNPAAAPDRACAHRFSLLLLCEYFNTRRRCSYLLLFLLSISLVFFLVRSFRDSISKKI